MSKYYTCIRADIEQLIWEIGRKELSYHPNSDISRTFARKIKRACFDCRDILDAYENKHSQEEWVEICLKYMGENE